MSKMSLRRAEEFSLENHVNEVVHWYNEVMNETNTAKASN